MSPSSVTARSERAVSTEEFGPIVSAEWLAAHLDDADLVVVDVRWSLDAGPKRADFERGHIASAVFADLDVDLSSPASTEAADTRFPPLRRSPARWAASASATTPKSSPMTMRVA